MALDGAFLHMLVNELEGIVDTRIDKIYQPSRDELVFALRKSGFHGRLFISVRSGRSRIGLTEAKPENPAQPPMFCMLLRKHLTGARIVNITQPALERIVHFTLCALNEMGDEVTFTLTVELISNQANLILSDGSGKIVDSIRRSDIESGKRLIQPGAKYAPPAAQEKVDPRHISKADFLQYLERYSLFPAHKAILNTFDGISPLIARQICTDAGCPDTNLEDLSECDKSALVDAFFRFTELLKSGGKPTMVLKDSTPFEFSFMPITQYGNNYENKEYKSFSVLLDEFYSGLDLADRLKNYSTEIERIIKNTSQRTIRKLQLRTADLEKCENREELRIYGELIKANLHRIAQGDTVARVENYYDENMALINIPLNPALSPSQNAAKYFKDYKKTYSTQQHLSDLIEKDAQELAYLESVSEALSRAQSIADVNEIKQELILGGYVKQGHKAVKEKSATTAFTEYKSIEGYKILVGKNNRQNDFLTLKLATKNDTWFHTKNIPGSHVIVFNGGAPLSEETVLLAARLAAGNSKAKNSTGVPVDYTPVKYVKKPVGAKPGMVIYTTNKTVFVTP